MFVWFEWVNYGHDDDEKSNYGDGDENIGDVKDDRGNNNVICGPGIKWLSSN